MKNKYKQVGNDIWIEHRRKRSLGDYLICWSYISAEDFDVADSIDGMWSLDYHGDKGVGQLPYIYNSKTGKYLHREILKKHYGEEEIKDKECDHIDGNRLNNRYTNLRPVTTAENAANRRKNNEKPISDPNGLNGWFYDITDRPEDGLKHIAVYTNSILIGRFKPDEEELANATWLVADLLIKSNQPISEVMHYLTKIFSESTVTSAIETVKKNLWWSPPKY